MRKHHNNFDLLRLIFAFTVFILHMVILADISRLKFLFNYFSSYYSVVGFFIISGFLITQSYVKTTNNIQYLKKRVIRILPPYILVVILAFFLLSFISNYSLTEYFSHHLSLKYLIYNLLFLNFLQPCLPGVFTNNPVHCAVNGSLWTIKIEVMFYITLPVIVYFIEKNKQKYKEFFLVILYVVSYFIYISSNYSEHRIFLILSKQLPGQLTFFTSGIILYYFNDFFRKNILIFLIPSILIFFLRNYSPFIHFFFPMSFAIIIYYFAFGLKFLNGLIFFGDISYGIYIYHFPIVQLFVNWNFFSKYNSLLVVFLTIVLVITLSLISWHFFEKPLLKLVRNQKTAHTLQKRAK